MWSFRQKIQSRAPKTLEQVFSQEFSETGIGFDAFAAIWREIARELEITAELLHPDDLLSDLAGQGEISPRLENLTDYALQRSSDLGVDVELRSVLSVRHYVLAFGTTAKRT